MSKIFQIVNSTIRYLEIILVSGGILLIAGSVIINVICRHLKIIFVGLDEVALWGVIWVTFFGTAVCARRGLHITMSALVNKIPEKPRKPVLSITFLITGIVSLLFAFLGWQLTYSTIIRGQVSAALRIPLWFFYVSAPFGFFLTGVYYCLIFIKNVRGKGLYFEVE